MEEKYMIGSIVKAISGREKNQLFVVLKLDSEYAYIIDGQSRKIIKPKKKNIKHLFLLKKNTMLYDKILNNKISECDIIKILKDYQKEKNV